MKAQDQKNQRERSKCIYSRNLSIALDFCCIAARAGRDPKVYDMENDSAKTIVLASMDIGSHNKKLVDEVTGNVKTRAVTMLTTKVQGEYGLLKGAPSDKELMDIINLSIYKSYHSFKLELFYQFGGIMTSNDFTKPNVIHIIHRLISEDHLREAKIIELLVSHLDVIKKYVTDYISNSHNSAASRVKIGEIAEAVILKSAHSISVQLSSAMRKTYNYMEDATDEYNGTHSDLFISNSVANFDIDRAELVCSKEHGYNEPNDMESIEAIVETIRSGIIREKKVDMNLLKKVLDVTCSISFKQSVRDLSVEWVQTYDTSEDILLSTEKERNKYRLDHELVCARLLTSVGESEVFCHK